MKTAHTTSYADGGSTSGLKTRLAILAALLALTTASVTSHGAPIAHWSFDEAGGTVAHDRAGGLDGTLSPTGAGFVAGGVSSNAISLSQAANGFVNMGNVLSLTSGDFSVVVWVKMNVGDTTPDTIVLSKHHSGYVNGYLVLVNQGGGGGQNNKACFYAGGLVADGPVSKTSVNDGNWHQVVGVYKSGVNKVIYVDGVVEATNSAPVIDGNDAAFLIGGLNQGGVPASRFTGLIDDVQVYNQALDSGDILYLFQNPGKVLPIPSSSCAAPPAGLVSWWRGETNAMDYVGTNHGTVAGNTTYGAGRVGQGFAFDGNGAVVQLGNPASLHLQELTIETWMRRASTATVSLNGNGNGVIFGYSTGGYGIYLDANGTPALSKIGFNEVKPGVAITDTNWHHLAVSKVGNTVVFYVDGVAYPVAAYDPGFTFSENAFIGGLGSFYTFYGTVDEVSVYSRPLATNEIQAIYNAGNAGKCGSVVPSSCTAVPSGLVSWWRGETNALDQAGTNNGTLAGNTTYGAGRVGEAFVFDGNGDGVLVGNPASLQLQNFTIETWIQRGSSSVVSYGTYGDGLIFGYGYGGYGLYIDHNGIPGLGKLGISGVNPSATIGDTNLHHLAVTKSGSMVVFYIDGVGYSAVAYDPGFSFSTIAAIGQRGDNLDNSFLGAIDEVSVFNRALLANEIQAIYTAGGNGKCLVGSLPAIIVQSIDQTVTVGETATFNVTASGAAPLSYQWRLNTTNISGATAATLVLTNVQLAAAGVYSVVVSNSFGTVTSSNAALMVNPLLACISPPAGLVSWWSGNGNASDLLGANNGIFNNGAAFGVGEVGQGFSFNGGSNNVRIPASSALDVGKSNGMTIEAWINPAGLGQYPVVEWSPGGVYGPLVWINVPSPGSVYADLFDSNGNEHLFTSAGGVIASNAFQHLAVTYDKPSGMGRIIVNGVLVAEANLGSFTPLTSSDLYIGYRPPSSPFGPIPFNGIIDEVSLYSRALSLGEVQAIYNAGSDGKCVPVLPASCAPAPAGLISWWRGEVNTLDQAGTNNGTLVGNTTFATGRVGQGFIFDGSGDAVSLGNPVSLQLQDFTIETWIKRASTTQASFDAGGGEILGYGGGGYVLGMLDNGTPFLSRVEVDNVMPNTAITDTNLHHLAVTKLGNNVVFYVDGVAYGVPAYNTTYNFATPAAIGARGDTLANSFLGTIDEVAVYNRQLSAGEIQAVYNAGGNGKCVTVSSPFITSQPATQTVTVGETATFSVTASGTAPLSYQWRMNSTNIIGATADSLVLTNVQPAAAGVYSVIVYNGVGTVTSSNATLTINSLPGCVAPPAGLVAWWRGENNPADQVGGNNGTLVGNATYGAGRVSQAFVFDGSGDGVSLGNPPSLMLQDFTIETWIKRANTTVASFDFNGGSLFSHGGGGYSLGIQDNGTLFLSRVEVDAVFASTSITDTNLHHLAVTKLGTTVVFYVDGVAYPAPPYNTTFSFATAAAIGARGDNLANSFLGTIDEVSVYSRPLAAPEIQGLYTAGSSGKCLTAIPASIVTQPANKTVAIGGNTTFSVTAAGTPPFSYQWRFNGTSITNATNATLTLANVQASQAGNYTVLVGNAALPPILSSNATLTVTYPVANVRLFGTNIVSGRPVTLPIQIAANGNENAVSFSLNYTTTRLNFRSAQLGDFPPGTLLFVNTSQTNLGRLGVTVALPSGATFVPGTQLLAGITFDAAISLAVSPVITQVGFGDQPMARGLTDVNALTLPATFTGGSVTLSGTDLEGDGSPRPGGSRSFSVSDYVQAGRFAAKLDLPAPGGEFQRADAAPRGTAGDGQIKVMDWVQAGRYFAGLDSLTAVGGPTLEAGPTGPLGPDPMREVRVLGSNAIQDVAVTLPVVLQAQGNENGVGFTVSFDPAALNFQAASLGNNAQGANLNLNTNQVASGKLGLVLVLPTGSSFAAGARELAKISWLPAVVGSYSVTLSDQLVLRGVSDPAAIELPASYVAGNLVVNPHPTLLITQTGTNVALAWPALATGFNLQSSTNATVSGGWSEVLDTPQAEGDNLKVTLPLTDQTKYFRLRHP